MHFKEFAEQSDEHTVLTRIHDGVAHPATPHDVPGQAPSAKYLRYLVVSRGSSVRPPAVVARVLACRRRVGPRCQFPRGALAPARSRPPKPYSRRPRHAPYLSIRHSRWHPGRLMTAHVVRGGRIPLAARLTFSVFATYFGRPWSIAMENSATATLRGRPHPMMSRCAGQRNCPSGFPRRTISWQYP